MAKASPNPLRSVSVSRRQKKPSPAVTTKLSCAIGTSTLACPRARPATNMTSPHSSSTAVAGEREQHRQRQEHAGLAGEDCGRAATGNRAELVDKAHDPHCHRRDENAQYGRCSRARCRCRPCSKQQPHRYERGRQAREFPGREGLVEEPHRERRRDREAQPEDRRNDADRAAREAAREVVKGDEDQHPGRHAPCERDAQGERAGCEAVEKYARHEEERLHQKKMMGPHAACIGMLVEPVRESIKNMAPSAGSTPSAMPVPTAIRASIVEQFWLPVFPCLRRD